MSQNSNPLPTNDKEASLHEREQESPEQPERELRPLNPSSFRQLYWIFMPVLAIVSYISVLRIGFLSDDFVLLSAAASARSPFNAFIFDPSTYFYRPIGQSLTWELGWQLWGFNPLPYHLVGLLLHAGIATLLGLWLAEVFQRRAVGWLAGALFAVFPLHAEAVGWLADQWDLWAALFTLLSLFLFTKWWRNPTNNRRYWYSLSLALFVLALFSKESVIAFLLIYAISAWLATSPLNGKAIKRLALSLLPFCLVLIFYLGLRVLALGGMGGYPIPESSPLAGYLGMGWEIVLNKYLYLLLAPISTLHLGQATQQWVALALGMVWLFGLIMYGRKARYWLLLTLAWMIVSFAPIFNLSLSINTSDLQQTRFFYLASAGYCIAAAALLYNLVLSIRRRLTMKIAVAAIGILLAVSILGSWSNLRSWQTASSYALAINQQLQNLIPPQPRPKGTAWYIQDIPDTYDGAYIFRLGLGAMQYFTRGKEQAVGIETVPLNTPIEQVDLTKDSRDSYAIHFKFDPKTANYNIDYLSGITHDTTLPTATTGSVGLKLWDFRTCSSRDMQDWQVVGATARCEPGAGMIIASTNDDPQMLGPETDIDLQANEAWFVRLRASISYPTNQSTSAPGVSDHKELNQWYWRYGSEDWDTSQSRSFPSSSDGNAHVYWTYVTFNELKSAIAQLRFDPLNHARQAQVEWIAIDLVR